MYRTVIQETYLKGPNFHNDHTVATWGCGTEPQGFAVINALWKIINYVECRDLQTLDPFTIDDQVLRITQSRSYSPD